MKLEKSFALGNGWKLGLFVSRKGIAKITYVTGNDTHVCIDFDSVEQARKAYQEMEGMNNDK